MSTAITDADDLEGEAPALARRPLPLRAQPAEPIPDAINADFLDALAVERALSSARNLASGVSGTAEARRAVWGHAHTPDAAAAVLAHA